MPTFISHSQKDRGVYADVCNALDGRGIRRWDPSSMALARPLSDQLHDAVNVCGDCIFIATPAAIASEWCHAELGAFWGAGKTVYMFVPGDSPPDLPKQFEHMVWTHDLDRLLNDLGRSRLSRRNGDAKPLLFSAQPDYPADTAKLAVLRHAWICNAHVAGDPPFYEIHSLSQIVDDDDLTRCRGMMLTLPYDQKLTARQITTLASWVRNGGRLAVAGFELGERHHGTNINELTYHFGIQFNSDVVVAAKRHRVSYDKGYDEVLTFEAVGVDDPLLAKVRRITMRNVCSLHLEPGAKPLVLVQPNQLIELLPDSAVYSGPPDYRLATGRQAFGKPSNDASRAVVALASRQLTGRGSVVAFGTWDFRSDSVASDNSQFLENLWTWLTADETVSV